MGWAKGHRHRGRASAVGIRVALTPVTSQGLLQTSCWPAFPTVLSFEYVPCARASPGVVADSEMNDTVIAWPLREGLRQRQEPAFPGSPLHASSLPSTPAASSARQSASQERERDVCLALGPLQGQLRSRRLSDVLRQSGWWGPPLLSWTAVLSTAAQSAALVPVTKLWSGTHRQRLSECRPWSRPSRSAECTRS